MSVGVQRLRDEPDLIRDGAIRKGEDPTLVDRAVQADANRRHLLAEVEKLKSQRNALSAEIGTLIKAGANPNTDPYVAVLRDESSQIGGLVAGLEPQMSQLEAHLDDLLLRIPNPPDADIPVGGEEANVTIRTWGEPLPHDEADADAT
ncbi:MAG TPA: hypothetical protein VIM25_00805, partial [Candidatus Limnocylindrales bacterium]